MSYPIPSPRDLSPEGVRRWRRMLGYSQSFMAAKLKVHRVTYARMEERAGPTRPHLWYVLAWHHDHQEVTNSGN